MSNQWDEQYLAGQGRYFPAEELVRFLGRTYGPVVNRKGAGLSAVEIGCGVGGNIKALSEWGFFTYGLECSLEALTLAKQYAMERGFDPDVVYQHYVAPATIQLLAKSVDLVLDIQTLQHLDRDVHVKTYQEVNRILTTGRKFFSVHWIGSSYDSGRIFPGHPELKEALPQEDIVRLLHATNFKIAYSERVIKTYGPNLGTWMIFEAVAQ